MAGARAANYEELKAAISREYAALPKQLQRIARYALERPHDLALSTVAAVAEEAEVQPSSMIRFANALGYSGFSEMQRIFRTHLVERSGSYRERIATLGSKGEGGAPRAVLHRFVDESVAGLRRLEDHVKAADLQRAVRLLARAESIAVLAQRRAFPVACYLAYALNQLEVRTQLLDGVGGMHREFARALGRRDVLVAISFRNYSPDVVEIAAECGKRGVPVLALTDTPLSPLAAAGEVVLEIGDDTQRAFRSLVEPLCLAQALVVGLGHHLAGRNGSGRRAEAR
jgi:DNA-binding MurR/RpiR family transcriptional regulator